MDLQALVERVQMLQKNSSSSCAFSMENVPLGFSTDGRGPCHQLTFWSCQQPPRPNANECCLLCKDIWAQL